MMSKEITPTPIYSNLQMGVGAGFAFHHLQSGDSDLGWLWTYSTEQTADLFYWPLYLLVRYDLKPDSRAIPYAKLDLGYTFFEVTNSMMEPDDRVRTLFTGVVSIRAQMEVCKWGSLILN